MTAIVLLQSGEPFFMGHYIVRFIYTTGYYDVTVL